MSIISIKIKPLQLIVNTAPFFYCALTFSRFFFENELMRLSATGALLGIGLLLVFLIGRKLFVGSSGWLIFGVALYSSLVIVFGDNFPIGAPLFFLSSIGYAAAIAFSIANLGLLRFQFYGYAFVFFAYMLLGFGVNEIFLISRNFISIFLLLVAGIYYIECSKTKRVPALDIGMLGLLLSIWANGRSGIIAFATIALMTVVLYPKNWRLFVVYSSIMLASLYFLVPNFDFYDVEIFSTAVDRYNRLGLEDVRSEINADYLAAAFQSFTTLFFGANLDSIPLIAALGNNPHNSLINLHVNYGLFGIITFSFVFGFAILHLIFQKSWLLLAVLGVALLRSIFDISAFYGPIDVILYSILFLSLIRGKIKDGNDRKNKLSIGAM